MFTARPAHRAEALPCMLADCLMAVDATLVAPGPASPRPAGRLALGEAAPTDAVTPVGDIGGATRETGIVLSCPSKALLRGVIPGMLGARHQRQILETVVGLVAVDVMDHEALREGAVRLTPDHSVLQVMTPVTEVDRDVATCEKRAPAFPAGVRLASLAPVAELPVPVVPGVRIVDPRNRDAAPLTGLGADCSSHPLILSEQHRRHN